MISPNILVGLSVDLPPGIPQGPAIEPAHASLQLDWIANEDYDLSEYIIRRGQESVDNELVLDSIASVNAPLTQFVDEGLLPGYVYYYAIAKMMVVILVKTVILFHLYLLIL